MQSRVIRIGTRGSPLALAQARQTKQLLIAAEGLPEDQIDIIVIKTSGDRIQDRALSEAGGKGLFTKEIEEALLAGTIDLAVHSAKDMPTTLPDGLVLSAYLAREDVRDALICPPGATLAGLPAGAVIGTASLRRQALLKRKRPDLETGLLRGNVETRIKKVASGEFAATLLAYAGLKRLKRAEAAVELLSVEEFPPAIGQGAIALETRENDSSIRALLAKIDDGATHDALRAERAFLAVLDGSCRAPIAGLARVDGGQLRFHGLVLTPDGSAFAEARLSGAAEEAEALGRAAGEEVRSRAPRGALGL